MSNKQGRACNITCHYIVHNGVIGFIHSDMKTIYTFPHNFATCANTCECKHEPCSSKNGETSKHFKCLVIRYNKSGEGFDVKVTPSITEKCTY